MRRAKRKDQNSHYFKTVIGFSGRDSSTNITYPDFVIRTFIQHCKNQSSGLVSYGGATFQGLINCCWKNFCNVESELRKCFRSNFMLVLATILKYSHRTVKVEIVH
jgi:hypothetical protein